MISPRRVRSCLRSGARVAHVRLDRASLMKRSNRSALVLFTAIALCEPLAHAEDAPNQMTKDDVITGTMNIDFKTRTQLDSSGDLKDGSPAINVPDQYKLDLFVAET